MTTQDFPQEAPGLPPLDDRPGPARTISSKRAAALIEGAIAAAAVQATTRGRQAGGQEQRPAGGRWQVAAAAGLLGLVGVAAAALWPHRPAAVPPPAVPAAVPAAVPVATVERQAAPAADMAGAGVGVEAPGTGALPGGAARVRSAGLRRGAEDLLQAANEHRRQRRWQEADRVYQRVMRAYPGSAAAHVAQVASAALHLEHLGQPREALRLYQGAVATQPGGPLAEEARYGLAESYRALGDQAGEARALQALLRGLGVDSPLRSRAEQRLRALAAVASPSGRGSPRSGR